MDGGGKRTDLVLAAVLVLRRLFGGLAFGRHHHVSRPVHRTNDERS